MLHRLATVFWWIGALFVPVGVMGLASLQDHGGALMLAFGVTGLCWSACYVLAGTFWRTPHPPVPPDPTLGGRILPITELLDAHGRTVE